MLRIGHKGLHEPARLAPILPPAMLNHTCLLTVRQALSLQHHGPPPSSLADSCSCFSPQPGHRTLQGTLLDPTPFQAGLKPFLCAVIATRTCSFLNTHHIRFTCLPVPGNNLEGQDLIPESPGPAHRVVGTL